MRSIAATTFIVALLTFGPTAARAQTQAPAQPKAENVKIISAPVVEHAGTHDAIIAWSTNVNSGTVVRYGIDQDKLDQTAEMPWGGITHRVTLKNLKSNTTYFFQAESSQAQGTGTAATSEVAEFHTPGEGMAALAGEVKTTPAPGQSGKTGAARVQAGPIAQNVTDHSASVWWETDHPSNALLKFGTSPNALIQTAEKPEGDQSHKVELTGLKPNTVYYVAIVSQNGMERGAGQFRTEPADFAKKPVGITNGPVIEYLTDNSVEIAWSTNTRSDTVVRFGTDEDNLNRIARGQASADTHRVTIRDLKPNTRYYFVVESSPEHGPVVTAKSAPAPFQTVPSGSAALRISMQK